MTDPKSFRDPWRWLALGAWLVFFLLGLLPIFTFQLFRMYGQVLTQDAIINSFHVVTLAWSGFFGWFVYRCCADTGIDPALARGKAMQMGIIALAAFMAGPLEDVLLYWMERVDYWSPLTASVAGFKAFMWCYLLSTVFRYYVLEGERVFVRVPSLFPSTLALEKREDEA